MSRTKRWLVVGVTVAVASFVMGLLGGLTGNAPDGVPPGSEQPSVEG